MYTCTSARALELDWCRVVPLERSFCRAFAVAAPHESLRLALADSEAARERGLMGVRHIPAGEGMLFVFPETADRRRDFWMKNTLVPLDMVFIGIDGTVDDVGVDVPAPKPGTPDDAIARHIGFGRYVIELPAGGAAKAGLKLGVRISIPLLSAT